MKKLKLKEGNTYYRGNVHASSGIEELVYSCVSDKKILARIAVFLFEILFNVCNFYVPNLSARREVIEFIQ